MVKFDDNFTAQIQTWLAKPEHSKDDLIQGATYVLKLTGNQAMFNTIMRRPERYEDKIIYELKKRLPMRLDHMTKSDVKALEAEILPAITPLMDTNENQDEGEETQDASAVGKRADHEQHIPGDAVFQLLHIDDAQHQDDDHRHQRRHLGRDADLPFKDPEQYGGDQRNNADDLLPADLAHLFELLVDEVLGHFQGGILGIEHDDGDHQRANAGDDQPGQGPQEPLDPVSSPFAGQKACDDDAEQV